MAKKGIKSITFEYQVFPEDNFQQESFDDASQDSSDNFNQDSDFDEFVQHWTPDVVEHQKKK